MNKREHLYRGKRKDNGEWVEGNLILYPNGKARICITTDKEPVYGSLHWVIPETVGEWTGLHDKNDRRIFEGYIIKTDKYGKIEGQSLVDGYDYFEVIYEPAAFRLLKGFRAFNLVGISGDYEVIGNIHDNPELLEVSEK